MTHTTTSKFQPAPDLLLGLNESDRQLVLAGIRTLEVHSVWDVSSGRLIADRDEILRLLAREWEKFHGRPVLRLCTVAQLAALLGFTTVHVRQLAAAGVLPAVRVGRDFVFDADAAIETVQRLTGRTGPRTYEPIQVVTMSTARKKWGSTFVNRLAKDGRIPLYRDGKKAFTVADIVHSEWLREHAEGMSDRAQKDMLGEIVKPNPKTTRSK